MINIGWFGDPLILRNRQLFLTARRLSETCCPEVHRVLSKGWHEISAERPACFTEACLHRLYPSTLFIQQLNFKTNILNTDVSWIRMRLLKDLVSVNPTRKLFWENDIEHQCASIFMFHSSQEDGLLKEKCPGCFPVPFSFPHMGVVVVRNDGCEWSWMTVKDC